MISWRPEGFGTEDDDPRAFLWWLERMAEHTERRAREALPRLDDELLREVEAALASRPAEESDHAQMHADAESTLRRALLVRDRAIGTGPILAVGDDDGVSLALALLGAPAAAVDVDPRVLDWIATRARALHLAVDLETVDVFDDPLPPRFARTCAAVVTDPPRSYDDTLAFLRFGAAALAHTKAPLVWADHPDWNFEHDAVLAALADLDLTLTETHELVCRYPLTRAILPDPAAKAAELSVDPAWLTALFARTRAWSNAYVLHRR